MSTDHPDTVLVDDQPKAVPEPTLPARAWYESPLLWVIVVVVVLLSIPLALEFSSHKSAPKAAAAPQRDTIEPSPAPSAEPPPPEVAPTRATPPSVIKRQPEPTRQMVLKCVENGRIIYTQIGACKGSMVPVPIEPDKNLVNPPVPSRNAASRPGE